MSHACGLEPAQDPWQLIGSEESGAFNPHRLHKKRGRQSIIPVYVFILYEYQQKIVTHSKLIIRVNFSLPHRSGVLEALNIVGLIKAEKKQV